jgi:NADH-quinone oxidoreductase subunit M
VLAEKPATDLTWSEKLPALLLLVALLALGFWPKLMTDSINDSVTAIYPAAEAVVPTDVARN